MKTPLGSDPEATATIFKSGKINVVGGRSEPEAKAVSRQFARRIQKLSWKRPEILADKNQRVSFNNFRIHNVFASVALPFDVKLREFASSRKDDNKCSYEPELNSAVVFQIPEPKASVSIRSTGHLTMQGSKVTAVYSALSTLYPLLRPFGKPKKKKPAAKKEKPKKKADQVTPECPSKLPEWAKEFIKKKVPKVEKVEKYLVLCQDENGSFFLTDENQANHNFEEVKKYK